MLIKELEFRDIKGKLYFIENEYLYSTDAIGADLFFDPIPLKDIDWAKDNGEIEQMLFEAMDEHIRASKKEYAKKIDSFGEDIGRSRKHFDIDNRLHIRLKSLNVNMTKFINEAIAEKLTREE